MDLTGFTSAQKLELLQLLELRDRAVSQNRIDSYYPDTGPLRRELYQKHLEFFSVGAAFRERCLMAANRIGKTESAAYESALHLTGLYPNWWEGKRFNRPVHGIAAGKTSITTRDIIQAKLLGGVVFKDNRKAFDGTGMVRGKCLDKYPAFKVGNPDLGDSVPVKHVTGGYSTLFLRTYEQGRGAFEGTEQDFIWLDEEPPLEIYSECLIRTMTTNGIIYLTFTPLDGATDTVLQFLPGSLLDSVIREAKASA